MNPFPITHYKNIASFLQAFAGHSKRRNYKWSYALWARQLQIKSPALLHMMVKGERVLTTSVAEKLILFFKFNQRDRLHFFDLVQASRLKPNSTTYADLRHRIENRSPLRKSKMNFAETEKLLSRWSLLAIREMVGLSGFKETARWFKSRLRFPVEAHEISENIKALLQLGLLARKDGRLVLNEENYATPTEQTNISIQKFHREILQIAREAIPCTDVSLREFGAITFNIRADKVDEAKNMLRDFMLDFVKHTQAEYGDETYQFNIQFFPLTK